MGSSAERPASDGAAWTVSNSQYHTQDVRFMSMQIVSLQLRSHCGHSFHLCSAAALKRLHLSLCEAVSPHVERLVPTFYQSGILHRWLADEEALLHLMSLQWEQMELSHTDALVLVLEKTETKSLLFRTVWRSVVTLQPLICSFQSVLALL